MMGQGQLKRALASLVTAPLPRRILTPLIRDRPIVFMMHRFVAARGMGPGPPLADLRATLEQVRTAGIPVVSLKDAIRGLLNGEGRLSVAFSVDDGYEDFDRLAAPVFAEFDCPVTVFVATGFLDGDYWYWWDKIKFAMGRTPRPTLLVPELAPTGLSLATAHDRQAAAECIFQWIKAMPEEARGRHISAVLSALSVEIPEEPPDEYKPLEWDRARALEAQGVDFGPHTVTHPSLGSLSPSSVAREVGRAYARLREELADPVPIFCFPYGEAEDVSNAAAAAIEAEGMLAAVTADPGYLALGPGGDAFRLPRFALPDNAVDTAQILYGFERFKELVRQGARTGRIHG